MAKLDVFEHFKKIQHLDSINSVLAWDSEICLPKGGTTIRHSQIKTLNSEIHRLNSNEEFIEKVSQLCEKNTTYDKHQIRNLKRIVFHRAAVDEALSTKIAETELMAVEKWKVAKLNSNFNEVSGILSELIKLRIEAAYQKKQSKYFEKHFKHFNIYDVMIDTIEPGLTNTDLKKVFVPLKKGLLELADKKRHSYQPKSFLPEFNLDTLFIKNLISQFGFDLNKGRIDGTENYPFCSGSYSDVRLTTKPIGDFCNNLLTTLHEMGHGLYEQNIPESLWFTPTGSAVSTAFHESQSRFYENQIGRSNGFIKYVSKLINIPTEAIHANLRRIQASPIRTSSDEIHYNLHIILRWEIEQKLIDGSLLVKDLPDAWNEKCEQYFGFKIKNDSDGCLQDVHWFMSDFGWFPTYTIGNLIAAQFYHKLQNKYPDWEKSVESGNFLFIKTFLSELHSLGATEDVKNTLKVLFGTSLSEVHLLKYLDERY